MPLYAVPNYGLHVLPSSGLVELYVFLKHLDWWEPMTECMKGIHDDDNNQQ